MPYVHISWDDVEDDELIEELEERGYRVQEADPFSEILEKIFQARRLGNPYEEEIRHLLYMHNGRAV
jgi:Ran GTPase-activating protein (RanGAP) involved in mRNA processing and transport